MFFPRRKYFPWGEKAKLPNFEVCHTDMNVIPCVRMRMKKQGFVTLTAAIFCMEVGGLASAQEGNAVNLTDETKATDTVVSATDEATETTGETAEEEQKDVVATLMEGVARMRSEIGEAVKNLGGVKDPKQSRVNRFERTREAAEENLKNVEKCVESIHRLREEYVALVSKDFGLTRIPRDKVDSFLIEGETALNTALRALSNKSEEVRLTGLDLFEKAMDKYRGVGMFAEVLQKYSSTVGRFDKKWSRAKDALERNRSKLSGSAREKGEASEGLQVSRLEQRMKQAGKDFNKDWFIPLSSNLPMLEKALERTKKAMSTIENAEKDEGIGTLPRVLQGYWDTVEEGIQLMRAGEFDRAEALLKETEVSSDISRFSSACLPQEMRKSLSEQLHDLASEIGNRYKEAKRNNQKKDREEMNAQRFLNMAASAIDRMNDDVADMQEDAKRREEEEARRREAEEARLGEEKESDVSDKEEKTKTSTQKDDETKDAKDN